MSMHRATAGLLALALVAAACSGDDDTDSSAEPEADSAPTSTMAASPAASELPVGYEGYVSTLYGGGENWICHPEAVGENVCDRSLDAAVVHPDGTVEVEAHEATADPGFDCFYVYPTISMDPGANSDLDAGDEEQLTVLNHAGRLTSHCEVYAPLYRQRTLTALLGGVETEEDTRTVAYDDVVDAWKHFVANDSDGRGFVLIGHSQGAGLLNALIRDEIDDEPLLADRLIGAYILGGSVQVPQGETVGGDFDNIPVCESQDQVGCVVSYASFRDTVPPAADADGFGSGGEGTVAVCVSPASPGGGAAITTPYFPISEANPLRALVGDSNPTGTTVPPGGQVFITYPEFLEVECATRDGTNYLEVHVLSDPDDARVDDIPGDLTPGWGLHLVDVSIAMGDIEEMVGLQGAAYLAG